MQNLSSKGAFSTENIFLSLDYDETTLTKVLREIYRLKNKFNIPLEVYQSSANSYHIRSKYPLTREKAFQILEYSNCSIDYKNLCKKQRCFPIRTGEKRIYVDGKLTETKQPPRKIFIA